MPNPQVWPVSSNFSVKSDVCVAIIASDCTKIMKFFNYISVLLLLVLIQLVFGSQQAHVPESNDELVFAHIVRLLKLEI